MFCEGPPANYSDSVRLLHNNGLSASAATIAAVMARYTPYDTLRVNTTTYSYLISAVQFALREAGFPVSISGGMDKATELYLGRVFKMDWQTLSWEKILQTIEKSKFTLAKRHVGAASVSGFDLGLNLKTLLIAAGALVAYKVLL